MKRSIFGAVLAAALIAVPAQAQMGSIMKPVTFGIGAGAAIPVGDGSDDINTGFDVMATLAINPVLLPVGFRIDAAYDRFGVKGGGANLTFTSLTGNVVFRIPSMGLSPYLIGGAGLYNSEVNIDNAGSENSNDFGFNVGGGIMLPLSGFNTFVEARYTQVQGDGGSAKFVPIRFGIMF